MKSSYWEPRDFPQKHWFPPNFRIFQQNQKLCSRRDNVSKFILQLRLKWYKAKVKQKWMFNFRLLAGTKTYVWEPNNLFDCWQSNKPEITVHQTQECSLSWHTISYTQWTFISTHIPHEKSSIKGITAHSSRCVWALWAVSNLQGQQDYQCTFWRMAGEPALKLTKQLVQLVFIRHLRAADCLSPGEGGRERDYWQDSDENWSEDNESRCLFILRLSLSLSLITQSDWSERSFTVCCLLKNPECL